MFPIGDDNSDLVITPYVNYAFIAINVVVFVFLQGLGGNEWFNAAFSLVPREITSGVDLAGMFDIKASTGRVLGTISQVDSPLPVYFNFLSSMFMHGGFGHLFGNMLFLWIFGDNLENLIGHIRFIVFYLLCGLAAAAAQIATGPDSIIPMLGASGAISGVLGGYVLLFPARKVRVLLLRMYTTVPAWVALGMWIGLQLIQGYMDSGEGGGVAYAAHIGGFFAGLAMIKVFAIGKGPRFFKKRTE